MVGIARKSVVLVTLALMGAASMLSCSTAKNDEPAARPEVESGEGGLWASLERSRREKEQRMSADGGRTARLESQLARGRAQVPPQKREVMERAWKHFLADDPAWVQSRNEWRDLGPDAREILVENMLIVLVRAFENNQGRLYQRARAELYELPDVSVPYLISGLSNSFGDDVVRVRCIEVLSDIGKPALPRIREAYEDADGTEARLDLLRAVSAMGNNGTPKSVPFLAEIAQDDDADFRLRLTAIEGLGRSQDERAVPVLIDVLRDDDLSVRKFAAASLGAFRDRRATGALIEALADSQNRAGGNAREREVSLNCVRALRLQTGRSLNSVREWQAWWQTQGGN